MKKKTIIVCGMLLVVVLIGSIIFYNYFEKESALERVNVQPFSLNDHPYYLQAIQDFPSDKYLGEILTAEQAKEKAINEWLDLFGNKIYKEKPYQVFFDEENEVWLVKGTLEKGKVGGVAYILIQKYDGKILAIWHTQ